MKVLITMLCVCGLVCGLMSPSPRLLDPESEKCLNLSASSLRLNFPPGLYYDYAAFTNSTFPPIVRDVGRLANGIAPYVFCTWGGIAYRKYQKGLKLYKAMRKPKNHPASQQDIANLYANGDTWFGDKKVAEDYANSTWGKANGYVVFTFETYREIRLFRLEVQENWDEIGMRMAAHEQRLLQTKATIKEQVANPDARTNALAEVGVTLSVTCQNSLASVEPERSPGEDRVKRG